MQLRDYQQELNNNINEAWAAGYKNVLAVMPTGAGKTVCFTKVLKDNTRGSSMAIAHRQELVAQMSLTLAKRGVKHNIIAPRNVVSGICRIHTDELGDCFFSPNARVHVAGVNTLVRRKNSIQDITNQVGLWIIDEAAHVLKDNTWGKAVELFPNAFGLGVTATPTRLDGKGLGRHSDGVFDVMVEGPTMRTLIDRGFLTDYRIFAPTSNIDLDRVKITASGEFSHKDLTEEVHRSEIVGDIVSHYRRIAMGKLGVTFVTDVDTAHNVAGQYCADGIPAVALSAKTPDRERITAIRKFRNREILQLVNVDLFSEGFDLPAIEVVSMGRPTQSYSWFVQAFGRGLRTMDGKTHALIIDHVGNTLRHGLPDAPRTWSLDRRERKKKADDSEKVKICPKCTGVYEAYRASCPFCYYKPVPERRDAPEFVEGDLTELDENILARLRGDVQKADRSPAEVRQNMLRAGASTVVAFSVAKNHREAQEAQQILRPMIRAWGEARRAVGQPDTESYREFYHTFGIDVMSAQALPRKATEELIERMKL